MALPVPSPDQIAALTTAKAAADKAVTKSAAIVIGFTAVKDKQQLIEDFQKSIFDAVNDDIIRHYELERRWMDGQDVTTPIVEQDLQDFVDKDASKRLWNGGAFDPLRIAEFDSGGLAVVDLNHELQKLLNQDAALNQLQNGVSSVSLTNGVNAASLTSSSTTGKVTADNAGELINNDILILNNATDSAIIKVINVVESGIGPFDYDFDIVSFLVTPIGTIAIADDAGIISFSGFNNTERTNKDAIDDFFQNAMDQLLLTLKGALDERKIVLQNQLSEVQANDNDFISETIQSEINARINNVDNFLGITPPSTIDISDTGITAFNNEKTSRQTEITNRITQISTEITNGADGTPSGDSYFDLRFNTTVGRIRLNNGSLVIIDDLTKAIAGAVSGGVEAQGLSDRYNSLIP